MLKRRQSFQLAGVAVWVYSGAGHTPAAMNGHPASTIAPGGRCEYDFTVRNRGGTYWYHMHAHGLTAKQAYNGLASFFVVDDDQRRQAMALDLRLGVTDLPLIIQDKQFDAQGKLRYQPNAQKSMMGWATWCSPT